MNLTKTFMHALAWFVIVLLIAPAGAMAQDQGEAAQPAKFKQEELDQMLAPVALYPDSLLTQILMASTYPLEIVQADRWAKQNKDMKGDALAKALEAQPWDPSVKSLVNFPQVLTMMSEKLDLTQKLGDAFLAQQKDVMDTIQNLRKKAQASGNLKTTKEQTVIVEKETIIIESANPQVIYVPSYNPTVVYGAWAYPAYPPYPYYPPGYGVGAAFVTGVAVGAAWGYAWGHSDWHGGDVDIDVNRNTNINNNINREKYKQQYQGKGQAGQGKWQHNPEHRKGAAYRDKGTAQRFGQSSARSMEARGDARGYGDRGSLDKGGRGDSGRAGSLERGGRDSAFSGSGSGNFERKASDRGFSSRQSSASSRGGGSSFSDGRSSGGSGGGGFSGSGSRGSGGGGRGGSGGGRR